MFSNVSIREHPCRAQRELLANHTVGHVDSRRRTTVPVALNRGCSEFRPHGRISHARLIDSDAGEHAPATGW